MKTEDISLNHEERKRLISVLRGIPFEHIEIGDYLKGKEGKPRHGMTNDKLKKIYSQFDKIIDVTKRPSKEGDKYCFLYNISKSESYYLVFRLDKKPKELFNAYRYQGDIEKRLFKKYLGHFFRRR